MKKKWNDEIVRVLENWAMWLSGSLSTGISPYPAYRLSAPGPRAGNIIPILSGEAEDADRIIARLPVRYQHPLRMHYCWPGRSDRSKAASCNCSINTYKTRLDDAHYMFAREWYERTRMQGT